ncbi:hypothetical protein HYS99_00995 [Candidatus Giovannonibacteria bacterium]|nr:hypothetical protein [Candidatus Giovannonibacteria bacterium]
MSNVDPYNIGWVCSIAIKPIMEKMYVLLVQNLKQEMQIDNALQKQKLPDTWENRRFVRRKLIERGILEKAGKWELAGSGKIAFWQGNKDLQEEFCALGIQHEENDEKKSKRSGSEKLVLTPKQEQFLKNVGLAVLADPERLLKSANVTLADELMQETGLILKKKRLIQKDFEGKNRDNPEMVYPRFIYLINKTEGELRTNPCKSTISLPKWVEIENLTPRYDKREKKLPFHFSHMKYLTTALELLMSESKEDKETKCLQSALAALKSNFCASTNVASKELKSDRHASDHSPIETDWEAIIKSVTPLSR